jgi:hypothetical protein
MSLKLRMYGDLDESALQRALDTIVQRHESLRTVFTSVAGQALQAVAPNITGFALRVLDLTALAADEREAQLNAEEADEARAGFDLSSGPLIRGRLIRLGSQQYVLLMTIHHIVADGWSLSVLVNELTVLYAAYREGRANPLPPLAVQYAD